MKKLFSLILSITILSSCEPVLAQSISCSQLKKGWGLSCYGNNTGADSTKVISWNRFYSVLDSLVGTIGGTGTVTNIAAGIWMDFSTITTTGTINADSAAVAAYLVRRKDSSEVNGWVTKHCLSQQLLLKADINSPVFTGDPTVPTPAPNDSDLSVANTEWVDAHYSYKKMYAQSVTTITSSNVTSEEILAAIAIPANSLSVGDRITVNCTFVPSGTGTKTARIRLNSANSLTSASSPFAQTSSTSASARHVLYSKIAMDGSSSQRGYWPGDQALITGVISSGAYSSAFSLASTIYVLITSQKTTGTDTFSLQVYDVEIIKAP